jgi:mevalonate kinase
MLTGEYLVMHGALSLALPLSLGQVMHIETSATGLLEWQASDTNGVWFEGSYALNDLTPVSMSDDALGLRLQKMLLTIKKLNPAFLYEFQGVKIKTHLEFNRSWGFGSSSSLVALLAKFADVDPMELHTNISNGSGYDVACALSENPVLFQRSNNTASWQHVDFRPKFSGSLYFVFLGNKQNSAAEVSSFMKKYPHALKDKVEQISTISRKILEAQNLSDFNELITQHEQILSGVLEVKTVKDLQFSDFDGAIKSLGAWGGDFILASSNAGAGYVNAYFSGKGCETFFNYDDIVLNSTTPEPQSLIN